MLDLYRDLAEWGGKSAVVITQIYDTYAQAEGFVASLLFATAEPAQQHGATWCLKRWLENGGRLSPEETAVLFVLLPKLEHWESQLHILQSMRMLTISEPDRPVVETFVRAGLTSQKKFVRAWAYSGFYELACQFPDYQQEALTILSHALQTESGSIRVRARKVLDRGF